ncbi:hypothetical protein HRJ34_11375 [Rhizorhabdus wittichii]|uniref:Preprotein translocase subunit SecB n=1 Tax=Rhizorhabdus wittichii TaxID=160791 RepID=A0A975D751_9SPHN|nr:hypothetical protein [Rhizorhabdus wittichii]QTH24048.1 hypothetical protein HRJ34_11375 [Rhizorhabdus wittichii]
MTKKEISTAVASEPKLGFRAADYNAVATEAILLTIRLISQRFDLNMECSGNSSDWKLSYGRRVMSCTFDRDAKQVAAIIQFEVTAREGRKKALHCTADYGIMYEVPADAEEEAVKGFCKNVGRFAIYPYFRSLFAQLAWNAELMLPPLPSIASTAHIPPKKVT